ncbi:MAG: site-specific integrase, partial [Muribaculaceae bacterium]|nr:site-specific integrase [Muribaculaceae bacterium]
MASIKVKFRPSEIAGREGSVYYQIIHERKVRQLLSVYRIFPYEWDDRHSAVITATGSDRRYTLLAIREHISHDMERLTRICARLDCRGMQYTADDIINEFNRYTSECSLFNFMGHIIARLQQNGKIRTSETYKATMNSFKKFLASRSERNSEAWNDDIMIDSITGETMEAFEAWHKTRGVSPNTISFYNRILRAVYNRAVEEWSIGDRNPFRHVYTGIDKTVKRALPLAAIKRIKSLNLSHQPMLDYARDMFMMSFYLRGMSFIDMAFLRKSAIRNGYVVYRRRKTGQILTIAWTSEM